MHDRDRHVARAATPAACASLPNYEAIWARAQVGSDRVARYLRARGLSGEMLRTVRLAPRHPYYQDGVQVAAFDAMLARVQTLDGRTVALHQTYLSETDDGKAPIDPARKLTRTESGATIGAAIRLADPGETLALAEGLETALAVMESTGTPSWATVSAGGMDAVLLPDAVRRIEIWADHDAGGAGQRAAQKAAARFHGDGREVVVLIPEYPGTDWLDVRGTHGAVALDEARLCARPWAPDAPPSEPGLAVDPGDEASRPVDGAMEEPRLLPDPEREPLEANAPGDPEAIRLTEEQARALVD